MQRCFLLLSVALAAVACGRETARPLTIGLSLDTLREERWQRDRDLFVARCEELGARVLVQAANNNEVVQNAQAEVPGTYSGTYSPEP